MNNKYDIKKKQKIGILASPSLSFNMISVLKNLGNMVGQNFSLHLITGSGDLPEQITDLYSIHKFPIYTFDIGDLMYSFSALRTFILKETPDLIMNICKEGTLGLVVATLGKWYNIPSLIRMTGETFKQTDLYLSKIKRLKYWFLHEFLTHKTYKMADQIVTLGDTLRISLIEEGCDNSRITVLPQPFNPKPYLIDSNFDKNRLKRFLGFNHNCKVVLFVGRLSWHKGADRLLKIVDIVRRKKDSEIQFCFVGEGEYRKILSEYPKDLVYLTGPLSHEEISNYYKIADIFLFPSRTEGLPNVILEAIASGLPVIASAVGEIPLYVSNIANSIAEYINYVYCENLYKDDLPEHFAWEKQRRAYLKLFTKVLREN
jgi:glycosyltransferase involved in cell wall biosynthesis